ncbi:zinc finger protein 708 isoform X1 [Folsomia candida]|nr:zinc finger protein 708 isoform X1 [Folsomia candida]XP_035713918.1 zinc finger protein 708 isoform X1 [Folsomia candida]
MNTLKQRHIEDSCYFCGGGDEDGRRPFSGVGGSISILETWSFRCVESISCLFRIPANDPFRQILKDANYCSKCIQVVRDVDFTLRLFRKLLGRLEVLQKDMLDKVAQKEINDFGENLEREISKLLREGSAEVNVGIDRFKHLLNLHSLNDSDNDDTRPVQHSSRAVKRNRKFSNADDNVKIEEEEKNYINFNQEEVDLLFMEQDRLILSIEDDHQEDFGVPNLSENYHNDQPFKSDDESDDDYQNRHSNNKRAQTQKSLIKVKRFRCSLCPALSFGTDMALNGHMRGVHEFDPLPYHCDKCPKKFKQLKSLKRHTASKCKLLLNTVESSAEPRPKSEPHHISDSKVGNRQSQRSSARVANFGINRITEKEDKDDDTTINLHGNNEYPSDKDDDYRESGEDEEDNNASDLSDNYRKSHKVRKNRGHTGTKKLQCPLCPASFLSDTTLKGHQRGVHENDPFPFHCTKCPKKFRIYKSLNSHRSLKCQKEFPNPPPNIPCPSCSKMFCTNSTLKKHTKQFHSQLYCSFCTLNFSTLEEVRVHEKLHENCDQPFKCVLCEALFSNSLKLNDHVALSHANNRFVCDICGVKFVTEKSLQRHQQTHSESYVGHKCEVCGHVFQSASVLKQHMNKHSATKNFTCEICGAGFKYPSGLKVHRISHEPKAELPYVCKICGKTFACKQFLLKHEEVHAIILSYECPTCGKKFKATNNLRQHVLTHEPKDPLRKKKVRKSGQRRGREIIRMDDELENDLEDAPVIEVTSGGERVVSYFINYPLL